MSIIQQIIDEEAREELAAFFGHDEHGGLLGDAWAPCACRLEYVADNGRAMPSVDVSACPTHGAAIWKAA